MHIEFCALATAIEAKHELLPPYLKRLIQHAPESFDDQRGGQIAATLRTMRKSGDLIDFVAIGEKHPSLVSFISSQLMSNSVPLSVVENYAEKCWQAYLVRRAKSIASDLLNELSSPTGLVEVAEADSGRVRAGNAKQEMDRTNWHRKQRQALYY